jgi:malonyl CoA-acyl carrier protein transacylase
MREVKIAFAAPGQGCQYAGMGEEVHKNSPTARQIFYDASKAIGTDLAEVCFGSDTERLEETAIAQPAIAAVTIANYAQLHERQIVPDAGLGHSLGELAILGAAGSISMGQVFELIKERAEITATASQERPGVMAVIKNLTIDEVKELLAEQLKNKHFSISNFNTSVQHVISGDTRLVEDAKTAIKKIRIADKLRRKPRFLKLSIPGAFHSQYHMEKAVEPFYDVLSKIEFREPGFPIMLNNGRYVHELGTDNLPRYLANQLVNGVDFVTATRRLYEDGIRLYVDLGPKPIVGNMAKADYEDAEAVMWEDFLEMEERS